MASFNFRWRKVLGAPEPSQNVKWPDIWDNHCAAGITHGDCLKKIVAETRYDYVTGRAGRITYRQQQVCEEHLQGWLKKHPEAREIEAINWQ